MRAIDRKLFRELFHLRGQAIAVALVVACGVASFVTARTAYQSLAHSKAQYYRNFGFADVFANLKRAPESVATRLRAIDGVDVVETRVVAEVTLDVAGLREPATGRLVSIPERRGSRLNRLHLRSGRLVEPGRRGEAIVSEGFATANGLSPGDSVGAVLNGRWQTLRIVGVGLSPEYVYELPRGGNVFPDRKRFGVFWVGRETLGHAFDMDGAFNDVALTLVRGARESRVIAEVDRVLERYGGLGAYGREDQQSNFLISNELNELTAWGTFMPIVFLGVAAFLLHIVVTRLVLIQRDQIAVMKAFGYESWRVALHFLSLVLAMVVAGSAAGVGLGLWLASLMVRMYAKYFKFPVFGFEDRGGIILIAVAVSVLAATLGALAAVRRAVRLPPAEAMRPEAPAVFHSGLIERLGLARVASPAGRIILRNLARRPLRLALSVLSVALAVHIVVVAGYFYDAIQTIIDVQFRSIDRSDASLFFASPEGARARHDLLHLPGVIRAETFRVAPVRLRFGHREKKAALTGYDPGARLRRIVGRDGQAASLPPDGLVLTTHLARTLGVRPGERVLVEVLEGKRTARWMPVHRLVDELFGVGVYMDLRAMNRLLGESPTVSGAALAVDATKAETLYRFLKSTPAVAGIGIRGALLQSFNENLGQTFGVFTSILVALASVIAIGMVYNGARIALSERGRELASLRVLGFTRGEVARMLLGEQAILILLAIPVGFLLGYVMCALITQAYQSDLFRMPLVVLPESYASAFLVTAGAALFSGALILGRIYRLDLVAVLKTRE